MVKIIGWIYEFAEGIWIYGQFKFIFWTSLVSPFPLENWVWIDYLGFIPSIFNNEYRQWIIGTYIFIYFRGTWGYYP